MIYTWVPNNRGEADYDRAITFFVNSDEEALDFVLGLGSGILLACERLISSY